MPKPITKKKHEGSYMSNVLKYYIIIKYTKTYRWSAPSLKDKPNNTKLNLTQLQ